MVLDITNGIQMIEKFEFDVRINGLEAPLRTTLDGAYNLLYSFNDKDIVKPIVETIITGKIYKNKFLSIEFIKQPKVVKKATKKTVKKAVKTVKRVVKKKGTKKASRNIKRLVKGIK